MTTYVIDVRMVVRDLRNNWAVCLNGEPVMECGSRQWAQEHADKLWADRPECHRVAEQLYSGE